MERSNSLIAELTMAEITIDSSKLTSYGAGWQEIDIESYCLPAEENTSLKIPHHLIQTHIVRGQQLLKNTDMDINEVAIACEFSNQACFYRHLKKQTGTIPRQFTRDRQYFTKIFVKSA